MSSLKYKSKKKFFFFQSLSKSFTSEADEDTKILMVDYENEHRQNQLQGSEAQNLAQSWSHLLVAICTGYRPSRKRMNSIYALRGGEVP